MNRADSTFVIVVATLWVGVAGLMWGTYSAGGSDSYGYVSQAGLWARGDLVIEQPVAKSLPWPNVDATLSPLGYRPGLTPGTIVPIYASGLPIVMAIFQRLAGSEAVFWVVPLMGMLTVVAAAGLAYRLAGPTAGAFSALLLGTSPTLLYSVMWPMSDVAAAGWWALALFCVTGRSVLSAGAAGTAAALAVMTRPNLVGVALAPFVYLLARAVRGYGRENLIRLTLFSTLTAAGCLAVAAIHTLLYGSPLVSGYGDLGAFFETSRRAYNPSGFPIRPLINMRDFIARPLAVEPALVVCAVLGSVVAFRLPRASDARTSGWLCLGVVGIVFASYLFFRTFPEWWYLRLMLPAYPALAVLAGLGVSWVVSWISIVLREPARQVLLGYLVIVWVLVGVKQVLDREVRYSWINESRYVEVGRFVAEELPENAAILAFHHSGSVRYYADRLTVRFDRLDSEWLEPGIAALRDRGYAPYFVVEGTETELFTERFGAATPIGTLDWPPLAEFYGPVGVRIYDPADQRRHKEGEVLMTREIASRWPGVS